MQTPDEKKLAAKIAPAIHAFTQAIADAGLVTSALIFSPEGEFLMRAGNSPHTGGEFVRLHYYLALVIAQLEASGHFSDTSITDAPRTIDPADVALRLATACIQCPSEMVPSRIRELADAYFDAVQS